MCFINVLNKTINDYFSFLYGVINFQHGGLQITVKLNLVSPVC